jgi:hypothetical protein
MSNGDDYLKQLERRLNYVIFGTPPKRKRRPKSNASYWKWVWKDTEHKERFLNVGMDADGTLCNPNGYPEQAVRAAIEEAKTLRFERHSRRAKKAAVTRGKRKDRRVYVAAQKLVEGQKLGPRSRCCICGKGLGDSASVGRGIGSECWQGVLRAIEEIRAGSSAKA